MRIGILFGGDAREREISFAGGRTVYDNIDKTLFTPVPIFIDSVGNWIILHWQYLYKGTIRDFYPPVQHLPASAHNFQVYIESLEGLSADAQDALIAQVGQRITPAQLSQYIDFAFLALHGHYGEDGQLQGLLESLRIPYSGSGIRASAIGMDKVFQKRLMESAGFATPKMRILSRSDWKHHRHSADEWALEWASALGFPLVIRPANQGSSIGVSIVHSADAQDMQHAIRRAFFSEIVSAAAWSQWSEQEQVQFLREMTDIRSGIGFPLLWQAAGIEQVFYHPETLLAFINEWAAAHPQGQAWLEGLNSEQEIIAESFIDGKEFSCIVIRNADGSTVALPPTEIIKGKEVFDYRSKYLAGLSRKVTPIYLPEAQIEAIRQECERLFNYLGFNVYARIDGFLRNDGTIFLNDPNTTSGMLPSSFFFHQAAEIGLNPSQFLTYIIRTSLWERVRCSSQLLRYDALLTQLDEQIALQRQQHQHKKRIGVLLGGYSSERHISVESGRNIYEKLSSSADYQPIPIFLTGNSDTHELYQLPINLLLKDNADDIRDKIRMFSMQMHPVIQRIQKQCRPITEKYVGTGFTFSPKRLQYADLPALVEGVFIALHGRPGEDGEVQRRLTELHIPFNGSTAHSAHITIDKYKTLQILRAHGMPTATQYLLPKEHFEADADAALDIVESLFSYPLIAKPVDDGCSSAVQVIKNRSHLRHYLQALFRPTEPMPAELAQALHLKPKEEFPQKSVALLETLITKGDALHFLEITGGLLTHHTETGKIRYELFEPSETLANGAILSLEEKFLAGEGQNITPARFVPAGGATWTQEQISQQVRLDLQKAAELLGVTGYARIDAFVRIYAGGKAETIIVEVNSLPGMTPATCIFHQCALNGYSPFDFIQAILAFGFNRN